MDMKHHALFSHLQKTMGGLEDPFSMATNFQAKLEEEAERRRRGGAPQGASDRLTGTQGFKVRHVRFYYESQPGIQLTGRFCGFWTPVTSHSFCRFFGWNTLIWVVDLRHKCCYRH